MPAKLTYFGQKKLFYPADLQACMTNISQSLTDDSHILVFPDATHKANGLPNGLAIVSPENEAFLLASHLRDPGCGFLLFKLQPNRPMTPSDYRQAGLILDELVNHEANQPPNFSIYEALTSGLNIFDLSTDLQKSFLHLCFEIDTTVFNPTEKELNLLRQDLPTLTNTVELKRFAKSTSQATLSTYALNCNDTIGFIHTGCYVFPHILGQRFFQPMIERTYSTSNAVKTDIQPTALGAPLATKLGYEYYQWIKAAMNYALVNRYLMFSNIKQALEKHFPCQVTLINDSTHAGVFEENINGTTYIKSTRGVQHLYQPNGTLLDLRLHAGQRETISALVTGASTVDSYFNFYTHGTSYNHLSDFNYTDQFTTQAAEYHLTLAKHAYYNTEPNHQECLPFTYNFKEALDELNQLDVTKTIGLLEPLVNIQSKHLIAGLKEAKKDDQMLTHPS